ncbi:MAG: esterase [Paenibacillaceae bacterium]|nr:esterase [Paenibacillaceae bacterium]
MAKHGEKAPLPAGYEELKAAASRTSSWKDRLDAVKELGKLKHEQVVDILMHRMANDPVYAVQEAAYRSLKQLGEHVQLPPRRKGEVIKGAGKALIRIKKSLPEEHTYEEFKEKLRKMRLDLYDAFEGDKGKEFDTWLEGQWSEISTRRDQ